MDSEKDKSSLWVRLMVAAWAATCTTISLAVPYRGAAETKRIEQTISCHKQVIKAEMSDLWQGSHPF
jgi:hypothetical protein